MFHKNAVRNDSKKNLLLKCLKFLLGGERRIQLKAPTTHHSKSLRMLRPTTSPGWIRLALPSRKNEMTDEIFLFAKAHQKLQYNYNMKIIKFVREKNIS